MSIRISSKNINFGDKKINKSDFYRNKKVVKIDDIDVNKILVSKEKPYGIKDSFKYFIGYIDNDFIVPLFIWALFDNDFIGLLKLLQMNGYVQKFEGNATMSFKINNKKLVKKYNQIWKRIEKLLKI